MNGRTGRMIILKQCFDNGLIPVIIRDDDKILYYEALNRFQTEKDLSMLVGLFEES